MPPLHPPHPLRGTPGSVSPGSVHYNTFLVVLSVIIAVIASTAALWAGTQVRGIIAIIVASLIMGGAVTGMH
jgi:NO-binding membrane sensor protein with MHYT domain